MSDTVYVAGAAALGLGAVYYYTQYVKPISPEEYQAAVTKIAENSSKYSKPYVLPLPKTASAAEAAGTIESARQVTAAFNQLSAQNPLFAKTAGKMYK